MANNCPTCPDEANNFPDGAGGGLIKSIKDFFSNKENAEWVSNNLKSGLKDLGRGWEGVKNGFKEVGNWIGGWFKKGSSGPASNMASNVNMNAYNSNAGGNSSLSRLGDINTRYRTTYDFFGADVRLDAPKLFGSVYNRTTFGTIHTSYSFYNDYVMHGLDSNGGMLLMHEYGHKIHTQSAPVNFYSYAMWSSFATAGFSWADTNWTEIRANTMAYYYFGQPKYKYWDIKKYPIDSNFLSTQEIYRLTRHLKPFNP